MQPDFLDIYRFKIAILVLGAWVGVSLLGVIVVTGLVVLKIDAAAIAIVSTSVGTVVGGLGTVAGLIIKDYYDDKEAPMNPPVEQVK